MAAELVCLGTADAFGSAGRHCAGYVVESEGQRILLDAGPGILSAMKACGLDPGTIDAVALSHLHGDHFCGVAFLLLEYSIESPRRRPLTIAGPPGSRLRIATLHETLYPRRRLDALEFPVRFVELEDGTRWDPPGFAVDAFRVPHQTHELSLGYRVEAAGRSLLYTGDTAWTPDLIRRSQGIDLLLCECTSFETRLRGHIRYLDLEAHRAELGCGRLLLTHLGREMAGRTGELPEELARDGLRLAL